MKTARVHLFAALGYACLATLLTWPLPLHLGTHLTGLPAGDTGSYVWNLWVFRHELEQGRLPFYTSLILTFGNQTPVDLSLHNYTTFANLLAAPMLPTVGVIAAFNLIYLLNITLSGYGMFVLVRLQKVRNAEAWLAGMLFAACPFLIARGTAHFSLVAAAPLPLFCYFFARTLIEHRLRDATLAGLMIAWAEFSDVYYAVYCLMIAVFMMGAHSLRVRRMSGAPAPQRIRLLRLIDALILIIGGFVAAVSVNGSESMSVLGMQLRMQTFYTPMLILTTLVVLRVIIALRPKLIVANPPISARLLQAAVAGLIAMVLPLSPVLYAFGERLVSGQGQQPPTYWRSSPPGADLLAFFMPNPNHPLWGAPFHDAVVRWSGRGDGFQEFTVAFPLVALGVILIAWRRFGWRTSPTAIVFPITFAAMSLGPFVRIAGFDTHIPTPWALLRYVPVISLARSPSRMAIIAMMGLCPLFVVALAHLTSKFPEKRRMILLTVGALLLFELVPAPRPLYSAEIPSIYRIIAADPNTKVRVLELPFGVRDGASSLGDFSALSQFYQTAHGKHLVGGAMSRVSERRKHFYQRVPLLDALMTLSEGRALALEQDQRAAATVDRFLARSRIGYVVVDRARTSPQLFDYAVRTLGLRKIAQDRGRELYVPREPEIAANLFDSPPSFVESIATDRDPHDLQTETASVLMGKSPSSNQ
jgi:hypothetical protein